MSTQTKQFIFGTQHFGSQVQTQPATQVIAEISKDKIDQAASELKGYLANTDASQATEQETSYDSSHKSKAKELTESFDDWAFEIQDSRFVKQGKNESKGADS